MYSFENKPAIPRHLQILFLLFNSPSKLRKSLFKISSAIQIYLLNVYRTLTHLVTGFQDSCLENPMDGGAWQAAVHGVAQSRTRLSDFPFTFYFHALEKEMATHSSVLAWRIPGTGEPGGLPSVGSHRIGHD